MIAAELYEQFLLYKQRIPLALSSEERQRLINTADNLFRLYEESQTKRAEALMAKIKKKVEANGYKYEEWLKWAHSLYSISKSGYDYYVTSNAKNWSPENEHLRTHGPYPTKVDADEKLAKLVGYKIKDRSRGRGDMTKDLESSDGK